MKAKLSFLALPLLNRGLALALCFGLAITFTLAACGGDSGTNKPDPGPGYSSGGGVEPPKDAGDLVIEGFDVHTYEKKVVIEGTVYGSADNPIVKVTYSIPGGSISWIKYQRESLPSNGTITDVGNGRSFDLNDAEIDLRNDDIPCGRDFAVNVEARSKLDSVARRGGSFKRDDSFCAMGNSSGAEQSSASAAVWKFGQPISGEAYAKTDPRGTGSYSIGSGSFELLGDADIVDQPDLKINGGKIKLATPCNDDGTIVAGPDGDVQVGTAYSSKESCLGSTPATDTNLSQIGGEGLGVQQGDYYLIYLDGGSVYLLFFTKAGSSFTDWPIKYMYWEATLEKP